MTEVTEEILLTAPLDAASEEVLARHGRLHMLEAPTEDALLRQIPGKTALVVRGAVPVTTRVIDAAPTLKAIARTGVGYDSVDVEHASRRGIPVTYTPGAGSRAVAEAAMAFMLAMVKRLPQWNDGLKGGDWEARYRHQGGDLDGRQLGIVGFGKIGRILAGMARPFDMSVVAFDPYAPQEAFDAAQVRRVELPALLEGSDIVSLHCPQTEETTALINAAALQAMKRGSYLINLARGGVIESLDVLEAALADGTLAGVALDVFSPAPPDTTHPIFARPECLVSPHAMATTKGAMDRIFEMCIEDLVAIFEGRSPSHVVNPQALQEEKSS